MIKLKRGGISLTVILVVLSLFILSSLDANAATLDFDGDSVLQCPADAPTCGCNDYVGSGLGGAPGILRCDNADFPDTLESSMTIDTCLDGDTNIPFDGSTQDDFYEYVVDIGREDLNGTGGNPYAGGLTDNFLRIGDEITISVTFFCYYSDDMYSILYKNSTNSNEADWQILDSGICEASGNQEITIQVDKKLDSVIGNHTIRGWIAYDYGGDLSQDVCPYDMEDFDSDTDDFIFEVIEKIDLEDPEINIITPVNNAEIELVEGLIIPVQINLTDQSGVDFVNISLVHNNISTKLNVTQQGDLYLANITGLTETDLYTIVFWANDTIETVANESTYNHVNNYTSINFTLKNDAGVTITNPPYSNYIQNTLLMFLDLRINDIFAPFQEVYYLLNENRTNLTKSKYIETSNSSANFVNNSLSNLSQSFTLTKNTTILNLEIYSKRIGSNTTNSTIQLVQDSSGPYGTVVANTTFNNVNNNTFEWVSIQLDNITNLSSGKYWVKLLQENNTEHINWAYNNTYLSGEFYDNNSIDLSLRIYDLFEYNATLNSIEGFNSLKVCENNSISDLECNIKNYYVDLSPPYLENPTHTAQVELGNLQTITVDIKDLVSTIDSVTLEFNATNNSMSIVSNVPYGKRYRSTLNLTELKNYNFTVYFNDTIGWKNKSQIYYFSVNDTVAPTLDNLTIYPTDSEILDPNTTLYFNISLFDQSTITGPVYLQIRPNTTSIWTDRTARNVSEGRYNVNYTPTLETKYYYRINTVDDAGNELNSTQQEVDILYERTWSYNPLTYQKKVVNKGETINLYNVTITNLGDVEIPFKIEKNPNIGDPYTMSFSNTTFNVSINSNVTIEISVDSPLSDIFELPTTAVITCLSNCNIKTATVGDSVTVGGEGPYLDLKIYRKVVEGEILSTKYQLKYNDKNNPNPYEFIARIGNVAATHEAQNISFIYDFPNVTGWVATINNTGNLSANFSLGRSQFANSTKDVLVRFLIDRKTDRSVLYNLTINASLLYNGSWRNFSKTVNINVSDTEEIINPIQIISSPSGPSSPSTPPSAPKIDNTQSSSTGTGGGLGGGTLIKYNLSVIMPSNVDVQRGTNKTIQINITNPYKTQTFRNITWEMFGYYNNQIEFGTDFISELKFNETKTISLTINAPSYMGYSVKELELKFDYVLSPVSFKALGKNKSTSKIFNLIINEVNREDSMGCLEQSMITVRNATYKNYTITSLEELLDNQRRAIASMDFTLASKLCGEISETFEDIERYAEKLLEMKNNIEESENDGYDMIEVKKFFNITNKQFKEGDYLETENSIKDLENLYILQIKIEDANLYKRFSKFIANNFWKIVQFIILLSVLLSVAANKLYKMNIMNKIKNLNDMKSHIGGKSIQLQKNYFDEKSVSSDHYNLHKQRYKEEIAKISNQLIEYKHKKSGFHIHTTKSLFEDEKEIESLIQDQQKNYYIEKKMDKISYEKSTKELKKTLTKIKKEIAIIENHREEVKENKLEILKMKLINKINIFGSLNLKIEFMKRFEKNKNEKN